VDAITQMSAMYRGWCNDCRDANAPQATFNDLSREPWWRYAHSVARKQRSRIATMIRRARHAGRLRTVMRNGRQRLTFPVPLGEKTVTLALLPPTTAQLRSLPHQGNGTVDLKAVIPTHWQSGRSLATRMAALERA
jgi:hypothetical protein